MTELRTKEQFIEVLKKQQTEIQELKEENQKLTRIVTDLMDKLVKSDKKSNEPKDDDGDWW